LEGEGGGGVGGKRWSGGGGKKTWMGRVEEWDEGKVEDE
jgi:hypothetical protein